MTLLHFLRTVVSTRPKAPLHEAACQSWVLRKESAASPGLLSMRWIYVAIIPTKAYHRVSPCHHIMVVVDVIVNVVIVLFVVFVVVVVVFVVIVGGGGGAVASAALLLLSLVPLPLLIVIIFYCC